MKTISIAIDVTATPDELAGAGYYVKEVIHELDACQEIDLKIITRKNDKNRFKEFAPRSEILNISPDGKIGRIFFQTFQLGPIKMFTPPLRRSFLGELYQLRLNDRQAF